MDTIYWIAAVVLAIIIVMWLMQPTEHMTKSDLEATGEKLFQQIMEKATAKGYTVTLEQTSGNFPKFTFVPMSAGMPTKKSLDIIPALEFLDIDPPLEYINEINSMKRPTEDFQIGTDQTLRHMCGRQEF